MISFLPRGCFNNRIIIFQQKSIKKYGTLKRKTKCTAVDFQLVASSFSSEYELEIDTETQLVNLIITVVYGEQRITKELQELWTFQILRLFEIYIQEQLNLEGVRLESEDNKEGVEMEREMKLLEYRKKMRQIKKKLMNNQLNQQEIDDVEDEIENLMNC